MRTLSTTPTKTTSANGLNRDRSGILQRKCESCGQHTIAGEKCAECERNRLPLQRRATDQSDLGEVPPIVHEVLNSPGQPLDLETRTFMESRFKQDFSQVRLHTDTKAAASAQSVNALAYTVGQTIVFNAGRYLPRTNEGRALIAHELVHTRQQASGNFVGQHLEIASSSNLYENEADQWMKAILEVPLSTADSKNLSSPGLGVREVNTVITPITPTNGRILQRQPSIGERLKSLLSNPKVQKFGGYLVSDWLKDPKNRQFFDDLMASVNEAPQHVGEFLDDEVKKVILENLDKIIAVTVVLLAAEEFIVDLAAVPTGVSQIIAAILQIIVIAVLGYFAYVEVKGAYEAGQEWVSLARGAKGNPATIAQASRSFVRMVWHITLAVLTVAGVRARIRGGVLPKGTPGGASGTAAETGSTGSSGATSQGSNVSQISSHPKYQPKFRSSSSPSASSGSAFGPGGTARQLAPLEQPVTTPPVPEPVPPQPASAAQPTTVTPPAAGPGVQPVPAIAAGVAAATNERPPFVLKLPQQKAPHLTTYRLWLGVLQSDPNYNRGDPGQRRVWNNALRVGGSNPLRNSTYERGHRLGFTGESGEEQIRIPNWSRTKNIPMEVDHIIELQVTPPFMRKEFNDVRNFELLDRTSNGTSGNLLRQNIAVERAKQVAFDPSAKDRVLVFDDVQLDGGTGGERWSHNEIYSERHLDVYENRGQK